MNGSGWAWQFMRASNQRHVERSAPLIRDLSFASRECFEELSTLPDNDFGLVKKGLVMLCGAAPATLWATALFALFDTVVLSLRWVGATFPGFMVLDNRIVASIGLILGIYTRPVAVLTGLFLLVASWASWRVSAGKWMWNFGGAEYPLFWALCCFIVALQA